MFDYTVTSPAPNQDQTVWSNLSLQPVGAGVLTPFSASLLAEICRRAWYAYYDRLGFEPTPRAQVIRRHRGRVYLNRTLFAQLDAAHAGLPPLSLRLDGQPFPLAAWEKPGFLAAFKTGRAQKRIDDLLLELDDRLPAVTDRARNWYIKTQELRWTQAEILQVMEEIERTGTEPMTAFLAARHNLELLYGRLLAGMEAQISQSQGLALINNSLCDMPGLVESDIAGAVVQLTGVVEGDEQLAWLRAGDYDDWSQALPGKQATAINTFLDNYGHRALDEGEIARPRWIEDPELVFRSLLACLLHPPKPPAKLPSVNNTQKLLDALSSQARKQGVEQIEKLRHLHHLQSHALHALAYIWAGTRRWALAAANEALHDGRLQARDDVFCYELEEIKEMMTGEWNISSRDEILAVAEERKTTVAAWQTETAPPLLVGDQAAQPAQAPLPAVAGHATGPFRRWGLLRKQGCHQAVIGADVLHSGWALALPQASAFVSAGGAPLDPFVVAARTWHHPVVVGLGPAYADLVEGAVTTVDAGAETVVSQ